MISDALKQPEKQCVGIYCNLAELLYCQSDKVHYARYNGVLWLGSDFSIDISYPINGLTMDADHIYVATDQRGVFVYSRLTQQLVAECAVGGYAQRLALHDGILYVAARHGGLQIVDVHNPQQPILLGGFDTVGHASNVAYMNGKVAVSSGSGGVYYFDVSNPTNPRLIQRISECGYANTVTFLDNKLVVASRDFGILFYAID